MNLKLRSIRAGHNCAVSRLIKTCISNHNNIHFATLSRKKDHQPLSMNKDIAYQRTENVIKRLRWNCIQHLSQLHREIKGEQERRAIIEKIGKEALTSKRVHYILHHAVKTPVRIVFDCICQVKPETTSPNACLMTTPLYK